jgi:hypothetical protein
LMKWKCTSRIRLRGTWLLSSMDESVMSKVQQGLKKAFWVPEDKRPKSEGGSNTKTKDKRCWVGKILPSFLTYSEDSVRTQEDESNGSHT